MATISLKITGVDELAKAFAKSPQIVQVSVDKAIKKSILIIQGKSIPYTPIDTGFLRNSYASTFRPLIGELEVTAPYALYVHEGTKFTKSNPYLQTGVTNSEGAVQEFFDTALNEITNKLAQ